MSTVVKRWTYDDLAAMPEDNVIGEVFAAPFDVVFSADNVCEPDILVISNQRSSIVTRKNVQGVPDFVIEILSEFNRKNDEVRKLAIYERFGVNEYWIIDPDANTIRVYRRQANALALVTELAAAAQDTATTPILPGLTIDLRKIMA